MPFNAASYLMVITRVFVSLVISLLFATHMGQNTPHMDVICPHIRQKKLNDMQMERKVTHMEQVELTPQQLGNVSKRFSEAEGLT